MSEWRPISTAPKDGAPVMGWVDDAWPVAIIWNEYDDDLKAEFQIEGYWNYADDAIASLTDGEIYPTHWMPLLSPPESD